MHLDSDFLILDQYHYLCLDLYGITVHLIVDNNPLLFTKYALIGLLKHKSGI